MTSSSDAIALLRAAAGPDGFVASVSATANYGRVWARDGVVCGLAALAADDQRLVDAFRRTLDTLARHQGPHGEIPSNVGADGTVSFGAPIGRVDASLWFALGAGLLQVHEEAARAALWLAGAWELNTGGLMYCPPASTWADEYPLSGYLLTIQALRVLALRAVGETAQADRLVDLLRDRYRSPAKGWRATEREDEPVFDGLANALAVLADLGAAEEVAERLRELDCGLVPAYWPAIEKTDVRYAELERLHGFGFRNRPWEYHNGGRWPMVSGFAAAALRRHGLVGDADRLADAIDDANDRANFPEFVHGHTLVPGGIRGMAWSAAAAVIARDFRL